MENNNLEILSKNYRYTFIVNKFPNKKLKHTILYSNDEELSYGDPAEIIGSVTDDELIVFLESVINEKTSSNEIYLIDYGYRPASDPDPANRAIEIDEVRIFYAVSVSNIKKIDFFEMCNLLCDAKINSLQYGPNEYFNKEELISLRKLLEAKIAQYINEN